MKTSTVSKLNALLVILAIGILSPLQANALHHMGLCYEKLGRTEAQKTCQYIIQNYPDTY